MNNQYSEINVYLHLIEIIFVVQGHSVRSSTSTASDQRAPVKLDEARRMMLQVNFEKIKSMNLTRNVFLHHKLIEAQK